MDIVKKRFDELAQMADAIEASKKTGTKTYPRQSEYHSRPARTVETYMYDQKLMIQWQTSVLSLFARVFGEKSPTFQEFAKIISTGFNNPHHKIDALRSIFDSGRSDFEGGYLFDVRNLVHAEVFTDELDQAKHFLDAGFKVPAAVIAGTVLESALRELCTQHPALAPGDKLNRMNDDLMGQSVYNAAVHKQVGSWAHIRNSAAHGKPEEFESPQVNLMIDGIRDFLARYMS